MNISNYWTHLTILLLSLILHLHTCAWYPQQPAHPHFVVIIPSYNNILWYEKNLDSIFCQDYHHFHVIYIDDSSTDGTSDAVATYIRQNNLYNKVTYIKTDNRRGALANLYQAIHSCADNDIVITVDGDDWLAHEQVLSYLAQVYSDTSIWMTFGQFKEFPSGKIGHCRPLAKQLITCNSFRTEPCYASHLRTFYAWLFKKIKLEDLLFNREFFPMTWDWAFLYPMLEMSGNHAYFIPDVLYIYNQQNVLSDHKTNAVLQQKLGDYIRQKKLYERI